MQNEAFHSCVIEMKNVSLSQLNGVKKSSWETCLTEWSTASFKNELFSIDLGGFSIVGCY